MSKNIWHKADERPEPFKTFVFKTDKGNTCSDMLSTNSGWNNILLPEFYSMDDFDKAERITEWAYLDDLLALETEFERTRKALDVAVDALGYYASENSWDETNRWMFVENGFEFARDVLVKIDKTLEQKDVK